MNSENVTYLNEASTATFDQVCAFDGGCRNSFLFEGESSGGRCAEGNLSIWELESPLVHTQRSTQRAYFRKSHE